MSNKVSNALELMDSFLRDLRTEKRALTSASGPEPTSHPVMGADDGTVQAREGERSSENEADIRASLGETGNTGQEDAESADGTVAADSIGAQTQGSDEVKGNVQTPKATKDDPEQNGAGDGSPGHPTNSTFSEKYSTALNLGNDILKDFASLGKKAEGEKESKPEEMTDESESEDEEKEKKEAAAKYPEDAEVGYMAAGAVARMLGFDKEAAAQEEQIVQSGIQHIIKKAHEDARMLHEYIVGVSLGDRLAADINGVKKASRKPLRKRAEGIPPELLAGMGGAGVGAEMGGGGGEMIDAAALGGGGMGGGGGEMGGGAGDDEAAIEALAAALEEAGITPEELAAAVASEGGGSGMEGLGAPGGEASAMEEETSEEEVPEEEAVEEEAEAVAE